MNKEGYRDSTAETAVANVYKEQKKAEQGKHKEDPAGKESLHLERVVRLDSIPAGSTYFNEQGFLHDMPIVTSTGIFEYALPDGKIRRELRLPEHVFDKESLSSYLGKPVIITHKAGSIDKNNVMNEIVGTIISEGCQDGNDVRCKVVIHDIDKVKKISYRELSLGYSLDLIEQPGEWNGEPYDAIQTNIRINHLAIVESARAGEQAHLNLDGKKIELGDKGEKEGGNKEMQGNATQTKEVHADGLDMTPEELIEAIKMYKASKSGEGNAAEATPEGMDGGNPAQKAKEPEAAPPAAPAPPAPPAPPSNNGQGDNVATLVAAVEKLVAAIKDGNGAGATDAADGAEVPAGDGANTDNTDCSNDMSQSMNNDSVDDILRQRLSVIRVGDRLHMDGLEDKSIIEAKKVIIIKALPTMNLDGKDAAYIEAAYDLAVAEIDKHKGVEYQRQQMGMNPVRADGKDQNVSGAELARQRMIERENGGGNE